MPLLKLEYARHPRGRCGRPVNGGPCGRETVRGSSAAPAGHTGGGRLLTAPTPWPACGRVHAASWLAWPTPVPRRPAAVRPQTLRRDGRVVA